jgi:hypothetical protein
LIMGDSSARSKCEGRVECYARRMGDAGEEKQERARVGLCVECAHARKVESDRGTRFYMCGLAAVNPEFRKYPVLPVVLCSGYVAKDEC